MSMPWVELLAHDAVALGDVVDREDLAPVDALRERDEIADELLEVLAAWPASGLCWT